MACDVPDHCCKAGFLTQRFLHGYKPSPSLSVLTIHDRKGEARRVAAKGSSGAEKGRLPTAVKTFLHKMNFNFYWYTTGSGTVNQVQLFVRTIRSPKKLLPFTNRDAQRLPAGCAEI